LALAIAAVFGGGALPCAWTSKLDVAIATASAGRYHQAVRRCAGVRQAGVAWGRGAFRSDIFISTMMDRA
jgi:hypothetical protein